ncbi:hypothetical protein BCV70DRAFT_199248 [Testicularia cyperi]|uniref:Uncharacterized protein n=1 Tax=Testicularia cyperi TaxID=1882483 RepID=A0A317XU97_9BASI|nr:hypothetical protein BCV70DRAFT_199248 [Testicularia cyperi]
MFPLVVAGLAAAGILAMMLLISIARAIAHEQLRRDKLKRTYGFDDNAYGGKGDKFTTSGQGMSAARSLRRAMTKKKPLGSFARRQADGSVLIEVGDEVFSVPPHLADTYRERILREKRSKSDLSASTYSDGPFGKIRPQHLTDFDDEAQAKLAYDDALNGEFSANHAPRRSLSQRLTDGLRALTGAVGSNDQDRSNDNNRNNTNNNDHSEKSAYSFDASHQPRGAMRQVDLASQMPVLTHGASDWSITRRGGGGGDEEDQNVRANLVRGPGRKIDPTPAGRVTVPTSFSPPSRPIVSSSTGTAPKGASSSSSRKPVPKLELGLLTEKLQNLEKQSQGSSRLPAESSLSHSRITLRDEPVSGPSSSSSNTSSRSGHGTFGGSGSELSDSSAGSSSTIPGSFPADRKDNKMTTRHDPSRARSIKPLILNMPAGSSHPAVGTYRHRKPTATATAEGAAGAGRSKTTHLSPAAARGHGPPGITIPKRNPTLIASVPLASPTRYTAASSNRPGVTMNPEKPQQAHYSQTSKGTFHPLPVPPPFKP